MKSALLCLILASASNHTFAANRAEQQCGSAETASLVKQIVREQLLPPGYASTIPSPVFAAGTKIMAIMPKRYDSELLVAECTGTFTVDASAGIDADTARALEVVYARAPDLMLMLGITLSSPPEGRVYDFPLEFSSQSKGGRTLVRVAEINDFKARVTGGLMRARAATIRSAALPPTTSGTARPGIPSATSRASPYKAPATSMTDAQFAKSFTCPEALPSEEARTAETSRFIEWVASRHPDWELSKLAAYRVSLLDANGCEQTLRNMRAASAQ